MATDEEPDPLNPQSWHQVPNVCGSCIAWRPDAAKDTDEIATGVCKLRPEIGRVPADLKKCSQYMQRGGFVYQQGKGPVAPKRRSPKTLAVLRQGADGALVRSSVRADAVPASFRAPATRQVTEDAAELETAPRVVRAPAPRDISLGEVTSVEVVRYALIELVRQEHGRSRRELHPRFKGGKVVAKCGERKKELPTERFFSMVLRLRESLDALDRAVGAKEAAMGEELRSQVGRMQGSFTTFNVLFADREDYFSSKE